MSSTKTLNKNLTLSIRIILSFLFLLSAVAKLYPSPYFALTTFEINNVKFKVIINWLLFVITLFVFYLYLKEELVV